jgi:hypothetical protein
MLAYGAAMASRQRSAIDWVHLVQAEYLEMPGLQLTRTQVRRLWGLDEVTCDAVLTALVANHFLKRTDGDSYILDAPAC